MNFSRRNFLTIAGLAGGSVALRSLAFPSIAKADNKNAPLLLVCYMSGGWDQLLALDPRSNTDPKFQEAQAYAKNGSGIFPSYDTITDKRVQTIMTATGGTGVQKAGKLTFGPAVAPSLLAHAADLSIARGLYMGTLAHEVGRRYLITGKFPRGLTANGSAITTVVAAADGKDALVPNLSIDTESYNAGLPAYAAPISVSTASDLFNLLRPMGTPLDPDVDKALLAFEHDAMSCRDQELDQQGLATLFRASREKARTMTASNEAQLFNFKIPGAAPDVQAVMDALGVTKPSDFGTAKGRAAMAGIALTHGVAQAVSLQTAQNLDTHSAWAQNHPGPLYDGFDAIGNLIQYLKDTEYMGTGTSTWSRTTLLVFSEFARTPLVNGREGRDHHLCSSCLVGGPGIKGGLVVGASSDQGMVARNLDMKTGAPDDANGAPLRPQDVHATLLQSMGLPYDNLSNQSPVLVEALLK